MRFCSGPRKPGKRGGLSSDRPVARSSHQTSRPTNIVEHPPVRDPLVSTRMGLKQARGGQQTIWRFAGGFHGPRRQLAARRCHPHVRSRGSSAPFDRKRSPPGAPGRPDHRRRRRLGGRHRGRRNRIRPGRDVRPESARRRRVCPEPRRCPKRRRLHRVSRLGRPLGRRASTPDRGCNRDDSREGLDLLSGLATGARTGKRPNRSGAPASSRFPTPSSFGKTAVSGCFSLVSR